MQDEEVYDITIIGAGPVGLFGAFYAGLRGMKTKIVDALPHLGGQPQSLYPEKFIYDMPGFPAVLAADLIRNLVDQASRFEPALALDEKTVKLTRGEDDVITLTTAVSRQKAAQIGSDTATHKTKTVLIAAGAGSFAPRKPTNVPNLAEYEGNGVYFYVQKKDIFRGKRLVIVGGGDSALDWAQNLEPLAQSITLIHRTDKFKAHEETVNWLLNRSKIPVRTFHEVKACGGNGSIQNVTIFNSKTKQEETVEIDALLFNLGFVADLGPLKEFGLDIEKNRIKVDQYKETNIQGVYAAGDICTYDGKLPLIATGVGEAATAVCYAKNRVQPDATVDPGHSSHMALSPTHRTTTSRDMAVGQYSKDRLAG